MICLFETDRKRSSFSLLGSWWLAVKGSSFAAEHLFQYAKDGPKGFCSPNGCGPHLRSRVLGLKQHLPQLDKVGLHSLNDLKGFAWWRYRSAHVYLVGRAPFLPCINCAVYVKCTLRAFCALHRRIDDYGAAWFVAPTWPEYRL